jgi:hypothetical protein
VWAPLLVCFDPLKCKWSIYLAVMMSLLNVWDGKDYGCSYTGFGSLFFLHHESNGDSIRLSIPWSNFMAQGQSLADSRSAGQEITCILWELKFFFAIFTTALIPRPYVRSYFSAVRSFSPPLNPQQQKWRRISCRLLVTMFPVNSIRGGHNQLEVKAPRQEEDLPIFQ